LALPLFVERWKERDESFMAGKKERKKEKKGKKERKKERKPKKFRPVRPMQPGARSRSADTAGAASWGLRHCEI
jgi:hypothetical protein